MSSHIIKKQNLLHRADFAFFAGQEEQLSNLFTENLPHIPGKINY